MKTTRSLIVPLALVALSLVLPATRLSAAEGIRAGVFKIYPTLEVDTSYDSNVYLESDHPHGDFLISVLPSLKLFLPMQQLSLQCEGKADFVRYLDHTDQNSNNYQVTGAVQGHFPGGFSFDVADMFKHTYFPTLQEFDVAEYFNMNQFYVQGTYQIRDALKFELQYYNYIFAYQKTNDLDRIENTFGGTLYWRFLPKTDALLELGYSRLGYTDPAFDNKNNQNFQVRAGLAWQATGRTKGTLLVGFNRKDYPTGVTANTTSLVAAIMTDTELSAYTILHLELKRATVESDYPNNPYYLSTRFLADLSRKITYKISVDGGVFVRLDDYPNETTEGTQTDVRSDLYLGGQLGLEFRIFRWLTLHAKYTYVNRNSNLDVFDYPIHQIDLSATASF